MNNLFVCHSQAQLIIASGLAKARFKGSNNSLILFCDFFLSHNLEINLKKTFKDVTFRVGGYPQVNKKWSRKAIRYRRDLNFLRNKIGEYQNIFLVCDTELPELFIIKMAKKRNKNVKINWLEDGSYPYYLNTQNKHGFNSNGFTLKIRKFLYKYVFGLGKFYDFKGIYMSGNKNIRYAYLTMPNLARNIFKDKIIIPVTIEEYTLGVNTIFNDLNEALVFHSNSIIFTFDKFDTYNDFSLVKKISTKAIDYLRKKDWKVFFKLHPREETNDLAFLKEAGEINKNLPFEYIMSNLPENSLTVVGFKSTSLQVARFFNQETISLINLIEEKNKDLIRFYNKLNVKLPIDNSAFNELIS